MKNEMKILFLLPIITILFACSNQSPSVNKNSKIMANTDMRQKKLIDSLVATIDDNYDPLHTDYTPSVHKLSELGLPAIEAVLPLLDNANEDTRMHAQRVVETLFKVKVKEVTTMNVMGKIKRLGRNQGKRPDWKKAIVTLAKDQKIEMIEGI